MNTLIILSNCLSMALTGLIMVVYFPIFGELVCKKKWLRVLIYTVFVVLGVLINIYKLNQFLYVAALFTLMFLFSFQYKIRFIKRIYSTVILYLALIFGEMITSVIVGVFSKLTIEQLTDNPMAYTIASILPKVLTYIVVGLLSNRAQMKGAEIPKIAIIAFTILPITSFAIMFYLLDFVYQDDNIQNNIICFFLSSTLAFSNLVMFLIFKYIVKTKENEIRMETSAKQLEREKHYYSELYERQTAADKEMHDLKNKFYAIQSLMQEDVQSAIAEMDSITNILNAQRKLKCVGNVGIDALLNSKISLAKHKGVQIHITSTLSDLIGIDTIDMCLILGNILDNAIEATEPLPAQKNIDLTIQQNLNCIYIIAVNDTNGQAQYLKTSKKDSAHHGYGLKNIRSIVEKYNGFIDIDNKDNKFKISIVLEKTN